VTQTTLWVLLYYILWLPLEEEQIRTKEGWNRLIVVDFPSWHPRMLAEQHLCYITTRSTSTEAVLSLEYHWYKTPSKRFFAATRHPLIRLIDAGWLGNISFITYNINLFEYIWREGLSVSIPIKFATIKLSCNNDVLIKSSSVSKLPHTIMIWRINATALCGVKLE